MKKRVWVLLAIFLCGCASNQPVSSVCTIQTVSNDLKIDTQITLNGTGDSLDTYLEVTSIDVSAYDDQQRQELVDAMIKNYSGYEGITMDGAIENNQAVFTMTIDLKTVSVDQLVALGIINQVDSEEFSFKATVDGLINSGYQCDE